MTKSALGAKMEVVDSRSSSNDLSSAPNSDAEVPYPHRTTMTPSDPNTITVATGSVPPSDAYNLSTPRISNAADPALERQDAATAKVRKPRKKKDDAAAPAVEKEKKPRKPRAAPGTGPASRKKVKLENGENGLLVDSVSRPSTTTGASPSLPAVAPLATPTPTPTIEAAKLSQNGVLGERYPMSTPPPLYASQSPMSHPSVYSQPQRHTQPQPQPQPHQPAQVLAQPTPPRSKPIFDPIRGVAIERPAPTPPPPPAVSTYQNPSPRPVSQSHASPAIATVINSPQPTVSDPQQVDQSRPVQRSASGLSTEAQPIKDDNAMEIDTPPPPEKRSETVVSKPGPKPRVKEQPLPLPTGSGLLSSSLFGGDTGADAKLGGEKGPNIVLHINLNDPKNKVINFARMAEEKYGFAALYPRQAAQKERLARVAAAGAALERAGAGAKGGTSASDSADEDLSVDIDRDSDNDGDAAMSGVHGKGDVGNSGTDGPAQKKRRKRKDEYDADDPFVDDSEMLWEAQAAASKDGFFVYIGPLVPEGEKPAVERADGTVKRGRGRGRGGGPGSRGGRAGAAAAAAAAAATGGGAASPGEGTNGRGGGPGSRGGGATRKPRITKAERQQRELDKKQRESMTVLAAKPPVVTT